MSASSALSQGLVVIICCTDFLIRILAGLFHMIIFSFVSFLASREFKILIVWRCVR